MEERVKRRRPDFGVIRTEMIDGKTLEIEQQEIFRYLGYGKKQREQADFQLTELAGQMEKELRLKCRPRYVYRTAAVSRESGVLNFGGVFSVKSESLCRNLEGCEEVFFMAVTLGAEADLLISRYCRMDMSRGLIAEAAATAVVEACCDVCCGQLEQTLQNSGVEGSSLRPRFSPGYGDFSLEYQKNIIEFLECPKKIGVTLTGKGMLVPAKSVTAVTGISDFPEGHKNKNDCHMCRKEDCAYRRED